VSETQHRAQEQVMKSLAAGTATLDAFLARAYLGFELQNFFTFGRGELWTSHAKWYSGGQAYPSWEALALFNGEATGRMLRTETISVPSVALPAVERRRAVQKAPLAAVYATQMGDRLSVVVLSRKVAAFPVAGDDGFTPVALELPLERAKSVTLYRLGGAAEANNVKAQDVKVARVALPAALARRRFELNAASGADERGLPPAATYLYVFDGIEPALR
jgi:hypothetical protein